MKFGVVVFPGSNCDHDTYHVISKVIGQPVDFIWHKEEEIGPYDAIILPGGFSYGDYLRIGAIARFSTVMRSVKRFAREGGLVLGICNGFQILCEAGLLPGALLRNSNLKFICRHVNICVEQIDTPFTSSCTPGQVLSAPIAHGEGNYYAEPEVIARLEKNRQVIFRYATADGAVTADANPNGSVNNIAGLCNEARNVVGLMPHPERACELAVGSADGLVLFESVVKAMSHGAFVTAR